MENMMVLVIAASASILMAAFALGFYRQRKIIKTLSSENTRLRQVARLQHTLLMDRGDTITQGQVHAILPGVKIDEIPGRLELLKILAKLTEKNRKE